MLSKEDKARLGDYFDPGELIELLSVSTNDIIEIFEEEIVERMKAINEYMGAEDEDE